jgi:uncharacterized protein
LLYRSKVLGAWWYCWGFFLEPVSAVMTITYNFEWDPRKAIKNRARHDVPFEEAATVFSDPHARSIFDRDTITTEDRWITMGISEKGRLLVVIHTFCEESKNAVMIRIISSRKATKRETKAYGE